MHPRFSLLPAPYTRAGRALADLRRLVATVAALVHLALGTVLLWTAYALGGAAALLAVVALLAFAAAFLGVCAALALAVWGVVALSGKSRAFARLLVSWAQA